MQCWSSQWRDKVNIDLDGAKPGSQPVLPALAGEWVARKFSTQNCHFSNTEQLQSDYWANTSKLFYEAASCSLEEKVWGQGGKLFAHIWNRAQPWSPHLLKTRNCKVLGYTCWLKHRRQKFFWKRQTNMLCPCWKSFKAVATAMKL